MLYNISFVCTCDYENEEVLVYKPMVEMLCYYLLVSNYFAKKVPVVLSIAYRA